MSKKRINKVFAAILALVMVLSLAACQNPSDDETTKAPEQTKGEQTTAGDDGTTEAGTKAPVNRDELPTLSLYTYNASLASGLVEGWRGDYLAEVGGFNLEVWAYSEEKTNAIMTTGDLPDVMFLKKGDNLNALIEAGLIINYDDYLDKLPNLYAHSNAEEQKISVEINRQTASLGTGGLYGLPFTSGSTGNPYAFSPAAATSQVKLKWDVYEQIGAPEIKDYWDLIDVMEQMLKANPTQEDGTKNYGTILNAGSDGTYWGNMALWYQWQGYDVTNLPFLLETDVISDKHTSILSKDSMYYEGLKWYNEVYRRGLMDPDSINTDRSTQAKKIDAGLAMIPSGTLPGYAPIYYEYYVPGTNVYNAENVTSSSYVAVVSSKTEHLDEALKLIDMWLTPETYLNLRTDSTSSIWAADGDVAYLTDAFIAWLKAGNNINGFKMPDGTEWSLFNTNYLFTNGVMTKYKDADGNPLPVEISKWPQYIEATSSDNATLDKWKATMGYETFGELLEDKGAYYGSSDFLYYKGFLAGNPSEDSMKLVQSSLKDVIVNASWKMVYAETEAEFDALWDKMVADCEAGNAKQLIDWRLADIENAQKLADK